MIIESKLEQQKRLSEGKKCISEKPYLIIIPFVLSFFYLYFPIVLAIAYVFYIILMLDGFLHRHYSFLIILVLLSAGALSSFNGNYFDLFISLCQPVCFSSIFIAIHAIFNKKIRKL